MSELSLGGRPRPSTAAVVAALPAYAAPAAVFVAVVASAAAHGAYYDTAWGWSVLAYAGVAAIALLARERIGLARPERLFLGLLAGFVAWAGLSATWSTSVPGTVREVERDLVYVTGVAALLLLLRVRSLPLLVGSLIAASTVTCAYSVATRVFPDRLPPPSLISGYRLADPLGYWNALGIFAAIGALLALGAAARFSAPWTRGLAAATLPVQTLTLYFTFSRGAWIALGCGAVVLLAADRKRLQLATTLFAALPLSALTVYLASRSRALTRLDAALAEATHDGKRLALVAAVACAGSFAAVAGVAAAERRTTIAPAVRRGYGAVLVVCLLAGLALVFGRFGSPAAIADRAWAGFQAPPPKLQPDLNQRLFTFSGQGRYRQWQVAWRQAREDPLLGQGAGTYESYWVQHRTSSGKVRDAHSLYLEVLGELGVVGLALLAGALAVPLWAFWGARRHPLAAAALAAYAAWLLHAAVDWDWEVPAVTLPALFCGCVLLVARRRAGGREVPRRTRAAGTVALAAVALAGVAIVAGNNAIERAGTAIREQRWSAAADEARTAQRWAPWAAEPVRRLGQSEIATGNFGRGRRHLREAIAKDPRNWNLWFDLTLATLGKPQERALAQALRLNPLSPELGEFRARVIVPRLQAAKSS
jgi:hypothetical protein